MRCFSENFKYISPWLQETATFPMGRWTSMTIYSRLQNSALYTNHSGPTTFSFSLRLSLPQDLHRLLSLLYLLDTFLPFLRKLS